MYIYGPPASGHQSRRCLRLIAPISTRTLSPPAETTRGLVPPLQHHVVSENRTDKSQRWRWRVGRGRLPLRRQSTATLTRGNRFLAGAWRIHSNTHRMRERFGAHKRAYPPAAPIKPQLPPEWRSGMREYILYSCRRLPITSGSRSPGRDAPVVTSTVE